MIKLFDGQRIRVNGCEWFREIFFGTIYSESQTDEKIYEDVKKSRVKGFDTAYTYSSGVSLTEYYEGKKEKEDMKKRAGETCQMLETGDIITVYGGQVYRVKVLGLQYSDPVKFIEIENKEV